MGIPVTKPEVIAAFEATDGIMPPTAAREALATELAPLFNRHSDGGGGSSEPPAVTYVQSAPATLWGPGAGGITHTFGRRAVVEVFDSAGTKWFTAHQEPTVGLVLISWPEPRTGSVVLR